MSSYYYSRTKGSITKRCIVTIEPCINVESAIYEFLTKSKNISLEAIKIKYQISEIEPACEGCLYGWCGQREHMDCPYGCLHDRNTCTFCT
jgi:hypothetical protein